MSNMEELRQQLIAELETAIADCEKYGNDEYGQAPVHVNIITARRNKVTGKAEREGFKVSAIRNELGEFYFDVKYNTIDWRSPEGEEVSMSPKAWFNLYMKIPDILGILGVEVDNDQSDS
jgi:hypothetical protein